MFAVTFSKGKEEILYYNISSANTQYNSFTSSHRCLLLLYINSFLSEDIVCHTCKWIGQQQNSDVKSHIVNPCLIFSERQQRVPRKRRNSKPNFYSSCFQQFALPTFYVKHIDEAPHKIERIMNFRTPTQHDSNINTWRFHFTNFIKNISRWAKSCVWG